ncbi:hypothetical protein [Actinopolymorpha alba]|nr:hypothetical protein [Actinopolymorpha alba]
MQKPDSSVRVDYLDALLAVYEAIAVPGRPGRRQAGPRIEA